MAPPLNNGYIDTSTTAKTTTVKHASDILTIQKLLKEFPFQFHVVVVHVNVVPESNSSVMDVLCPAVDLNNETYSCVLFLVLRPLTSCLVLKIDDK